MKRLIDTIVASGGGIRCVCFIGVFKRIEELLAKRQELETKNTDTSKEELDNLPVVNISTFAGVSAGSIFGLMYLMGFTPDEMEDEIINKKLDQLKDIRFLNFTSKYGIDTGNNIMKWIESLMTRKDFDKDITFDQFFKKTNVDFQVFATNLNKYNFTKFNYTETPNLKVTDGIRMSISIPFMFTINKFNVETKELGNGDTHVDGGLIDSYPIYLFKHQLETTLGLKLVSHGELHTHQVDEQINDLESYIYHVLACFMVQRDRKITLNTEYTDHTIYIDTQGITQTVNFGLSLDEKKQLIKIGYSETNAFFKS
jgi:NTE family protein